VLTVFAVPVAALASPASPTLLAKDSTSRSYVGASRIVHLRADPVYESELRADAAELFQANSDLKDAQRSILHVGKLTTADRKREEEFLAPIVRAVKDANADIAQLKAAYLPPFRAYGFRVTSDPSGQSTPLDWSVFCGRQGGVDERQGAVTKRTPFTVWRAPTLKHAYSCLLDASADRGNGSRGLLTISLLGRR
jgi:hypothetical protein